MARPRGNPSDVFTTGETAYAMGVSARNFALLCENGLGPATLSDWEGKSGSRSFDGVALAHAALIGAFQLAGFELLVAARLGWAFADAYGASHGRLPSNLLAFARDPENRNRYAWGQTPEGMDPSMDYWAHHLLDTRSRTYRRGVAMRGDCIVEIADKTFVLTKHLGLENLKIHSPVTRGGLLANPEYRILGKGAQARIVPIHEELESFDFHTDPVSADRLRKIEDEFLAGLRDAVTTVRVNISLAIRNAFDRLADYRSMGGPKSAAANSIEA